MRAVCCCWDRDETFIPSPDLFQPVDAEGYIFRRLGEAHQPVPLDVLEENIVAAHKTQEAFSWQGGIPRRLAGSVATEEDFQSAHEDLVASREQLLSLNEELTAVNSQLAARVAELESGRHNMADLLGATNIAALSLDAELRIERFTSSAATLLSLCDTDLGRPWAAVARGFDAARHRRAAHHRDPHFRSRKTSGPTTTNATCVAYRSTERKAFRWAASWSPSWTITRQIESDAQLRRFATMLRDSADAIVVMDFGGRIVAWNRGAQRLYGYTQSEALRLNVRDLMTGDRLDSTLEVMRRVARGEAMPPFDTQRRTREGRIVDVSGTVALLFDSAGNPESLAATERDITARRRAEDETRMLNARLEQRVAERATELQHSEEQIRAILDATADAVVTNRHPGTDRDFQSRRGNGFSATRQTRWSARMSPC